MTSSRAGDDAGFTLIELLVVVAVLGIVMAISIVSLLTALDKAKQRSTMADMRSVGRAIEAYQVDNGVLPADGGGLVALKPVLTPYQINVLSTEDHWSNPYAYTSDSVRYTIESYGKDGIDGPNITYPTRHDFDRDIVLSDGVFVAAPE